MADYIYTMESRLLPEQMRTLAAVQTVSRARGMNLYLTGGAIRDILTGYPIRDLDFTVQGDPLKLQHELEKAGGIVDFTDPNFCVLHLVFQGTGVEIGMARSEAYDKPGKPPTVTPGTITEDLRRRDFTCNAMALSLNEGSRGLLLDPFNGAADIEARLLRVLHSYAFLEDPSRLIRATRFAARFGWELEERTRARYESAREGEYIQYIGSRAIGYEIERLAYEENPIAVMRALEEQGWLKVLHPKWTAAKADTPELAHLLKTRATMAELNLSVNSAPAAMEFLTRKLGSAEVAAIQKSIPHREFVAEWKRLEDDAKELSKKLLSREAATNSGAWKLLSSAKPEAMLYLEVTGRNKTAVDKIKNFLGPWRQLQEKIPVAQMTELRITPQLPEYSRICQEAFMLLLDGKLRTEIEIAKFLAPYEPPPPPPPPMPVRRRAAKKAAAHPAKAAEPVAAAAGAAAAGGPIAGGKPAATIKAAAREKAPSREEKPARAVAKKAGVATSRPVAKSAAKPAAKGKAAKPAQKKSIKPQPKKAKAKPSAENAKPSSRTAAKKQAKPAAKKKQQKPAKKRR
jgi:tRNA nucleotidyltransferase (CCA-adding enzyme)